MALFTPKIGKINYVYLISHFTKFIIGLSLKEAIDETFLIRLKSLMQMWTSVP